VVSPADLLFDFADLLRKELDGTAALSADHVVMAAAVVLMFVAGNAVMKGDFAGQAAFGEKFQGAVDGGVSDAGVFFLNQTMEFVGGKMVARFEEGTQNRIALGGLLETNSFQMPVENVLRLSNHLPREGRLIINTLLEHAGCDFQNSTAE